MKIEIPKQISNAELIDYMRDKPDLLHLRDSYHKQVAAYEETKNISELMSFFALAASVEIYLKIHYVVVFWLRKEQFSTNDIETVCHLVGQRPQKVKISIKRFSHNILGLLRVVMNELDADKDLYREIESRFKVFGDDWTAVRYSTQSLRKKEKVGAAAEAFQKLIDYMKKNDLDVVGKIVA